VAENRKALRRPKTFDSDNDELLRFRRQRLPFEKVTRKIKAFPSTIKDKSKT
jgi:hypothetical protein